MDTRSMSCFFRTLATVERLTRGWNSFPPPAVSDRANNKPRSKLRLGIREPISYSNPPRNLTPRSILPFPLSTLTFPFPKFALLFSAISSNTSFQTAVVLAVLAHVGALLGVWLSPQGFRALLLLNAIVALAVLLYAASRARYIYAARDWPYAGLVVFELVVLGGVVWAFRDNRTAAIWSYIAFGLHGCASLAAALFAFTFKMNRLM
jgi:hypothetical protein